MTTRPLKEKRLPELRQYFDENVESPEQLRILADELGSRNRTKAKHFCEEVDARLRVLGAEGHVEAGIRISSRDKPIGVNDSGAKQINGNQQLLNSLERKFPLLSELRFFNSDSKTPEPLPPVIALMASMTNPDLPGDACVVLPCRERVAAFTAVLAALSAAKDHFPILHEKYVQRGFVVGERVRVLPTGHVFEFGGFFAHEYSHFFKLRLLNDKTGVRSFPIKDAVLLEKTTRKAPKARVAPVSVPMSLLRLMRF